MVLDEVDFADVDAADVWSVGITESNVPLAPGTS